MRAALTQIERIEHYLLRQLNPQELQQFEQELKSNPELQEEVHLQQQLMQGIQLIGLKKSAQQAYKHFRLMKWMRRAIVLILIAGGAYFAWIYLAQEEAYQEEPCVPCEVNEGHSGTEDAADVNCCDQPTEAFIEIIDTAEVCDEEEITEDVQIIQDSLDYAPAESSSNLEIDAEGNIVMENPEHPARFKQGNTALNNWLARNLEYPVGEDYYAEVVEVKFWVNYDGKVLFPKITKGKSEANKRAVLDLMKKMPDWVPAEHKGKIVSSFMRLQLDFGREM